MHKTARALMDKWLDAIEHKCPTGVAYKVLDVGSRWVNGSYKETVEGRGWSYLGLDIADGGNVDVLALDPYNYPFEDNTFDIVISGSTMEHVQDLRRWTRELLRVVRSAGWVVILTVNEWPEHRHPLDCWRVLPDGMRFVLLCTNQASWATVGMEGRDTWGVACKRVDWKTVEGSELHEQERNWLCKMAQEVGFKFGREAVMATIGVWHGASMYCLRAGSTQAQLIGIDSDMSHVYHGPELNPVVFIEADSRECHDQVPGPLHLLLIDGDHHKEVIQADIENWTPKVAYDGVVVFHDYNPGPKWVKELPHLAHVQQAVTEWLERTAGQWMPLPTTGSLAAFRRIAK